MPQRELFRWEVRSFTVLLALDVVEKLAGEISKAHHVDGDERGGILFGQVIDNDNIRIDGFQFHPSTHRRGVPYDLNLTERRAIQRRVCGSNRTDGRRALGFFRTHLRPGLFLDQRDFALMSETFSDCPGIALLIRPDAAGRADAGIFFWEDGDIERKQSDLIFPFDAEALRLQGPIEIESDEPRRTGAAGPAAEPGTLRNSLLWGIASGLATGVLAFALLAELHVRSTNPQREAPATPVAAQQAGAQPASPPGSSAGGDSASANDHGDVHGDGDRSPFATDGRPAALTDGTNSSVDQAPRPRWAGTAEANEPNAEEHTPQPKRGTKPAPLQMAAVTAPPPAPIVVPPPPSSILSLAASSPLISQAVPPVTVDVSVEPKQRGAFKRAMGHVPLLGRLRGLRHDEEDVTPATPASGLKPQIPADLRKSLGEEVTVDIDAAIDDTGAVKWAEIARGGESQLSLLAENAVRRASWEPARAGERDVPMEVVVHYRFSPEHGPGD